MKVRIKVKHLIYTLLFLFALLPLVSRFIQPQIEMNMIEKEIAAGNITKAKLQISKLLNQKNTEAEKWELIQKYMLDGPLANRFDVYVGPSMSSWAPISERNFFTVDESVPYLTDYVRNGPLDGYMRRAAEQLALHYQRRGNYEKADQILVECIQRVEFGTRDAYLNDLFLKRLEIAFNGKNFRKSEEITSEIKTRLNGGYQDVLAMISLLETEMLLQEGKFDRALKKVNVDIEALNKQWDEENRKHREMVAEAGQQPLDEIDFEQTRFARELFAIRRQLEVAKKLGYDSLTTIEGRIMRADGTPLNNVGVFLREESYVNMSVSEEERFQTVTDENGYYQFQGVIPGNYQVHLGLMFEQVDGWAWSVPLEDWITVTGGENLTYNIDFNPLITLQSPVNYQEIRSNQIDFKWDKVKQASYYNLNLCLEFEKGGSTCSAINSHIKENEIRVLLEDLYDKQSGVSFSGDGPALKTVIPESLLAFANPKGEFSWYVEAFDEEGNMITKSSGYRLNKQSMGKIPVFYIKERELTEADRLLLEQKVLPALELYKKAVEVNPNDIHSLRMVVRLMGFEEGEKDGKFQSRYSKKTLPYLIALAEKRPSEDTIFPLVSYYYEKSDWEQYERWYRVYKRIGTGSDSSTYVQSLHATAQMRQGDLKNARQLLYEVMESDPSHRFVGNLIALELYLNSSPEIALKVAKEYPQRGSDAPDWISTVENLTKIERDQLKEALQLYFYSDESAVAKMSDQQQNLALRELLKALLTVN